VALPSRSDEVEYLNHIKLAQFFAVFIKEITANNRLKSESRFAVVAHLVSSIKIKSPPSSARLGQPPTRGPRRLIAQRRAGRPA
jgi:hypothetical protein